MLPYNVVMGKSILPFEIDKELKMFDSQRVIQRMLSLGLLFALTVAGQFLRAQEEPADARPQPKAEIEQVGYLIPSSFRWMKMETDSFGFICNGLSTITSASEDLL